MNKIKELLKKNMISILETIFILLIVILVGVSINNEIRTIDLARTVIIIRDFSNTSILFLIILGIVSVSSITLYDFFIAKYLNLNIKPIVLFSVSFLASTINNVSGLGGLTGASIRSLLFKKDSNNKNDIVNYNLLLIPATAIGLSVMAIIALIKYKYISHVFDKYPVLFIALIVFFIYLIIYPFIDKIFYKLKNTSNDLNNRKRYLLKFKLLLVSIIEWTLAYSLFLILIIHFDNTISLFAVFGIFTIASIAGIISMLPGGVGSFDLIVLLGLQYYGLSAENILASLILFRIFYYILPLLMGVILTLIVQSQNKGSEFKIFKIKKLKSFINQTSSITNLFLSILVFLSGIVLLTSALIPGLVERTKIAEKLLSFSILNLSRQLSITIGILLIYVSNEIRMKVKRAYRLTLWLLILGAIFTFLKGLDYEEAIFLSVVLILLRMSKNSFHRKSLPFNLFSTIVVSVFMFIGMIIYRKLANLILLDFFKVKYFKDMFKKGFLNFRINGFIIYISFIVFLIIWELTKQRISNDSRYEEIDEERIKNFLDENTGSYLSHLIFLKDKHVFYASSNKVILAFEKNHNVIVVLGDPIGNEAYFGEAITEFQRFIDEYGFKSVFYEVCENLLSLYHEHGYYFFKLGETALINLQEFDISSPKSKDFRNVLSRFKKDGYIFELLDENSIDSPLYEKLKKVSDEWLQGRNEMGFSLGFMDKGYLNKSKVGIIIDSKSSDIIAFVSIMPKYDYKAISIDLMRFQKNSPSNTMTFLILNLINLFKEKEYEVLNIGMAPLSSVGDTKNAHFKEKIAHLVFKYGKNIYSFAGLRNYKEKFKPTWKARYLAYEDITLLPSSLIEVSMLIHSKKTDK